jgi:hypothetical protein
LGHYRRYSKTGLRALCALAGLSVRKLQYMNFLGLFGWWVNAKILKREEQSEAQIAFFDSWIVPLQSRIEDLVRPPCGQSLFAVLEKDGR